MLSIVVAMDSHGLIGKNRGLPWHIAEDLGRFRRMTWGKTVIMGRSTYEGIGHPLEGRHLIVMSRSPSYRPTEAVQVAHSVADALVASGGEAFVAGGAAVYEAFLPFVDRLEVTVVHGDYRGDTYFPVVDWNQWRLIAEERGGSEVTCCTYRSYERIGRLS